MILMHGRGALVVGTFAFMMALSASCNESRPGAAGAGVGGPTVVGPPTVGPGGAADAGGVGDAGGPVDGATNSDGPGEKWVRDQLKPSWLQIDTQYVYWLLDATGQGAVMKMPLGGGTPTVVASDLVQPDSLRIDTTSAYWLAYGDQGGIHKVPLAGGQTTALVSVAAPIPIRQIALDATSVYYTDAPAGVVRKVDKNGGAPSVFAAGLSGPSDIAIDASGVYVVQSGDPGAIVKIPVGGGVAATLATGQPDPHGLVLTVQDVYWINGGTFDVSAQATVGAAVMRLPKSGGQPTEVVKAEGAKGLLADGIFIYYGTADSIMRAPAGGGAATAFAPMQKEPRSIAADGTYIYWTNWGTAVNNYADGDVRRLTK